MIARVPPPDAELPAVVLRLAGGRPTRPLWRNELGGLTVAVGGDEPVVVKWAPPTQSSELLAEAERLEWAAPHTPVPELLAHGRDEITGGAWLVTRRISGSSAVDPRWIADPEPAIRAIGVGLRALHDMVPVADCPFRWALDDRRAGALRRAAAGRVDPSRWHDDHRDLTVDEALGVVHDLAERPEDRVVCHGDACAPNTMVDDDGDWVAHVDLGRLGVADRWADLAVATWSTVWNHGPGWEEVLLDGYGIDADPDRIRAYRILWDLGP